MNEDLEIIRTIQSTDRFDTFEAKYKNKTVFAKKAKNDKTRELLARVPENSSVANKIGQKTAFKFRTPEVVAQEGDWLITEWIDGESLIVKAGSQNRTIANILSEFLIVLDGENAKDSEVRKTFEPNSLRIYMQDKLPNDLTTTQKVVLAKAKQLFDELNTTLTPSWQDGDIKPDHIFADPRYEAGYVLVDPEHFDPKWPRFYSLANNYVKYLVKGPKEFSTELIQQFISKSHLPEKEIFQPLLASIIVRGISLHWEPDYDPGAEHYNIPRSQELLKTCITAKNLKDLLY